MDFDQFWRNEGIQKSFSLCQVEGWKVGWVIKFSQLRGKIINRVHHCTVNFFFDVQRNFPNSPKKWEHSLSSLLSNFPIDRNERRIIGLWQILKPLTKALITVLVISAKCSKRQIWRRRASSKRWRRGGGLTREPDTLNVNKSAKDWRMTLQLFAAKYKCWNFESSKQGSTHNKPSY